MPGYKDGLFVQTANTNYEQVPALVGVYVHTAGFAGYSFMATQSSE